MHWLLLDLNVIFKEYENPGYQGIPGLKQRYISHSVKHVKFPAHSVFKVFKVKNARGGILCS
jgi:hypothetical protein